MPAVSRNLWAPGQAKNRMSLFPGPQGKLFRNGSEPTIEQKAASQIYLQIGLTCMVRGDLTSDQGVALHKTKESALNAVTPQK